MTEDRDTRLRRLRMRAWRRGTREMDLILGPFADVCLTGMEDAALDLFEALLDENDHDLYGWVSGQAAAPRRFAALVAQMAPARDGAGHT
ncbi:MAG: succinate dehydrogenase assembly factor 2 [Alphaproteobacteria bacterium HGW-Alphaproteobacteria-2]|nr:MAG: succinate dehydrogenase assembly factor 2 [Alphaproteobacteria bacterium HGW-Alphaproteobacteria-2]